jgi:hypothetical protein
MSSLPFVANVDIFEFAPFVDAIGFTSNGTVKANGRLVMGAGVADSFRLKREFSGIDRVFGEKVEDGGNNVYFYDGFSAVRVFSFPTKQDPQYPSILGLIQKSARQLMAILDATPTRFTVALAFPGIGRGNLSPETVWSAIKDILDNRVVLVWRGSNDFCVISQHLLIL